MEKTKNQLILEAAFEVFGKKSFHKAKMEEIAEQAGVGKGTIYEYFQNKSHLFQEMMMMHVERYFNELDIGINEEDSATEKLYNLILNHVLFVLKFKSKVNKLMSETADHMTPNPEFRKRMISFYKNKVTEIQKVLQKGINDGEFRVVDVELAAMYFMGALHGLTNNVVIFNLQVDSEQVATQTLDFFVNGIRK